VIQMTYNTDLIDQLKKELGISWNSIDNLRRALTHSSYAHENKNFNLEHNQRLEFLGDAVLELAVSDFLYNNYPEYPEGALTKMRAGIVCEPSLASLAREMNLGDYLLMGKGEERSGGRKRPSILADAVEALIGAIYLDQGFSTAHSFVVKILDQIINQVVQNGGLNTDFKTQLQELVQKNSENTLCYQIIDEYGPDHSKTFVAGVSYQGKLWGSGSGRTKKEAEQAAAKDALDRLDTLKDTDGDKDG